MWGYILLEQYSQTNYNFSFPSTNSTLILQLIQWQYWWWFWFTYFIVLYYFLFLRTISFNLLKFSPSIVTSFSAHGKWGDFIVCVVPISWCLNILTNSNFILRMLEWQMESSLLTVRVRGNQWYWIYNVEINEIYNLLNTSKNIGHNYWVFLNNTNSQFSYFYLNSLNLHFNNQFIESFWNNQYVSFSDNLVDFSTSLNSVHSQWFSQNTSINTDNGLCNTNLIDFNSSWGLNSQEVPVVKVQPVYTNNIWLQLNSFLVSPNTPTQLYSNIFGDVLVNVQTFLNANYLNYVNRFQKASTGDLSQNSFNLLNQNVSLSNPSMKLGSHSYSHVYFVLNQNKSFLNNSIKSDFYVNYVDLFDNWSKVLDIDMWSSLYLNDNNINSFLWQSRNNSLLRTNRILILPSQVNIAIITNSFDVIHSWYIPGLGIKLDCVPGSSTHHNLHIQNIGFYYGQCAEICGSYHHHMPIRICAVNFNHFILWWSHYGYPTFFNNNVEKFNYQPTLHNTFLF